MPVAGVELRVMPVKDFNNTQLALVKVSWELKLKGDLSPLPPEGHPSQSGPGGSLGEFDPPSRSWQTCSLLTSQQECEPTKVGYLYFVTMPLEPGTLELKPDWSCHCSWSAQRVVLRMDDDRWATLVKGTSESLTKVAPYWLPTPSGRSTACRS